MANRFARGAVAVAGALLTFGAVSTMLAIAAGASANVINRAREAGWQSGNGSWTFRWVQTTFTVPVNACGSDDFQTASASLKSAQAMAIVGVGCVSGVPRAGWSTTGLMNPASGSFAVHGGDSVSVSIYYDKSTGYDYFHAKDNTTGMTRNWANKAGAASYHYAFTYAEVNNPLQYPPPPGTNYVLVPYTGSSVTSLDGTHGQGLNGPWGVTQVQAVNGSQVIAAAPVLYNNGSTFNVRVYGSA
jgi:hypothetical protein